MMQVVPHGAVAPLRIPNAPAMLCWLFKTELTQKATALVDELADGDAVALDDDERRDREKEILAARLMIERQEEACISAAEDRGLIIARRGTADGRATLGLNADLPWPLP